MTLQRFDHPLDALLDSLGTYAQDCGHDGEAISAAATVIRAMTADGKIAPPKVLITSGWSVDPLIAAFEDMQVGVSAARDELGAVSDRVDEVLDTLRRRIGDRDRGSEP